MTLVSEAMIFAARAHDGALRKGTNLPYIVHPAEVAAIAAALTDDPEVLAAALLHDVMEDCGVTQEELTAQFGSRVAHLVLCESQIYEGDPRKTWIRRKQAALGHIAQGDPATRIIAMGDKLSNMRAIRRDYDKEGDALFLRFHQRDKRRLAWYYRSCAKLLQEEFGRTDAWFELNAHIEHVFAGVEMLFPEDEAACAV